MARTNMPNEDLTEEAYGDELALLKCFPAQIQATKVMAVLAVVFRHSPDDKYIGEEPEPTWSIDRIIKAAFERFSGRLKEVEGIIDARNSDPNLKNRYGARVIPYKLLKTSFTPGATMKGVPNSISI